MIEIGNKVKRKARIVKEADKATWKIMPKGEHTIDKIEYIESLESYHVETVDSEGQPSFSHLVKQVEDIEQYWEKVD